MASTVFPDVQDDGSIISKSAPLYNQNCKLDVPRGGFL